MRSPSCGGGVGAPSLVRDKKVSSIPFQGRVSLSCARGDLLRVSPLKGWLGIMCSLLVSNRVRVSCLFRFQGAEILALPHNHGEVGLDVLELLIGYRLSSNSTQTSTDRSQETLPNLVSPSDCALGSNDGGPQSRSGSNINENSAKGFVAKLHQIGSHLRQKLKSPDCRDTGSSTVPQSTIHKLACVRK